MAVDPTATPAAEGSGWPDNGEPDGGGQSKTAVAPIEPRDDLVGLIRLLGKIMLARNLGIGL